MILNIRQKVQCKYIMINLKSLNMCLHIQRFSMGTSNYIICNIVFTADANEGVVDNILLSPC